MTGKVINHGSDTQSRIIEGVIKTADAIKTTLGPAGKCVAIDSGFGAPEITRDGATVAKSISFSDPVLNMGAQLVKKAASRTEEQCGDSTSTTSILLKEFCEKGRRHLNAGCNVNELKSGMLKAMSWVKEFIKSSSIKVEGDFEKIKRVATISANNDPVVGSLVVECMEKVGINGIITADVSSGLDTQVDVTTGMKLERGWSSPHYVTSPEEGKCVMDNPYVIIVGEKLSSVNQILGVIEGLMRSGRPFLIVCDEIDDVVNSTLIMNTLNGMIRCCVVKGIDFGDNRKNIMADLAVATGGKYLTPENGLSITTAIIEDFGSAQRVVIDRDSTIIYQGAGDPVDIETRANVIKARLNDPNTSEYDKTKFEKRLANLVGGIGIIKAGGASEAEKLNLKATITDSILASKSAIEEGCVPGGGYVYYKASLEAKKDKAFWKSLVGDEKEGAEIVFSSLPCILRTVAENSGRSGEVVLAELNKTTKQPWGYNAKTKKYCYLLDDGILDSAKAIRVALENSVSTAAMILLTDCTIIDEEVDKKESLQ